MIEETITVKDPHGLHARPAAEFVKAAQQFQAAVMVEMSARKANAKSLISLLSLGIDQGSVITIIAEGPDEALAVQTLKEIVGDSETNLSS